MSSVSIKLPDDLKKKALRLAKKKNTTLNGLVNHWLQTAIVEDETIEWMKRQLRGKNPEFLINEFGKFLGKTKAGIEPSLDDIQQAMKD